MPNRQTTGQTDRQTHGQQSEGRMNRRTDRRNRQTAVIDRQTERQAEDRQTDRGDSLLDRLTDRQTIVVGADLVVTTGMLLWLKTKDDIRHSILGRSGAHSGGGGLAPQNFQKSLVRETGRFREKIGRMNREKWRNGKKGK